MAGKKINYAGGDELPLYATPEEAMREGKRREELERRRRQMKYGIPNQHSYPQQYNAVNPAMHQPPSSTSLPSNYQMPQQGAQPQRTMLNYEHGAPQAAVRNQPRVQGYEHGFNNSRVQPSMVAPDANMSAPSSNYSVPQQNFYKGQPSAMKTPDSRLLDKSRNVSGSAPVPPTSRVIQSPTHNQIPYKQSSGQQAPRSANSSSIGSQESLQEQQDQQIASQLFNNHDVKNMGRLTADELHNLLQNDDGSKFCSSSIESLINLFGGSRFGTVNLSEFISLYKRVKKWRKCFVDHDVNGSFTLTMAEFYKAVQSLGYLIPFEVSEKLFECYAEYFDAQRTSKEMKFDRFVETLVWLMRLTKVFRKYDLKQEGIATIEYKDFIDLTLYLGKFLPH